MTEFLMGDLSKQEFLKMYYKNTENFSFLIINNNCSSSNSNLNEIYGNIKTPEKFIKK